MDAPYQPHSATSREAATKIRPKAIRLQVFEVIKFAGDHGRTDVEIQDILLIEGSTQRPRRVELLRAGLIRDSGRTRATASGRQATVWVAT